MLEVFTIKTKTFKLIIMFMKTVIIAISLIRFWIHVYHNIKHIHVIISSTTTPYNFIISFIVIIITTTNIIITTIAPPPLHHHKHHYHHNHHHFTSILISSSSSGSRLQTNYFSYSGAQSRTEFDSFLGT